MAETAGPKSWTPPAFRDGLSINGVTFKGGGYYPATNDMDMVGGGFRMRSVVGTGFVQLRWLGGNAPINLNPTRQSFDFRVTHATDYYAFLEYAERGELVELWFDRPAGDQWSIALANAGQTTWRTSRPLPYSLPGISHATRAPEAWLEDAAGVRTPLTVVTVAPGAGEIQIPDTGGIATLTTLSGLVGRFLVVQYPPIMLCQITEVSQALAETKNNLRFSATVEETLTGSYSPKT